MLYVTLSLYSWTYPDYNTIKQISLSRKRELPLLEKVKITDIGSEGNAVARVKNLVVFTPMLIPGDVVDIQVTRKRRKYLEGIPVRFHEYSKDRINPVVYAVDANGSTCLMISSSILSGNRLLIIFAE